MKRISIISGVLLSLAATACDESSPIGESIVGDNVSVVIDSAFTVTGRTVDNGAVQSRTLTQILGSISTPAFGRLSSTVVTQFMSAAAIDTVGITSADVDSLHLVLRMGKGDYTGDSIVPMGIEVYRLNRRLPSPIYSDFDPEGYFDPSDRIGSAVYNATNIGGGSDNDNFRYINVALPLQLGRELFDAYKANPANFATPSTFISNVFPGVYIANSYGSGRLSRITSTTMRLYYHRSYYDESAKKDTTVYKVGNYFAVTPEIITNNNISLDMADDLLQMQAAGDAMLVAPAGLEVEFKLPVRDIIAAYNRGKGDLSVINSLSLSLPVDSIANDAGIAPPPYVLMVRSDKKAAFFADNELPDNLNSFYAKYDSTARRYYFGGLRDYLLGLVDKADIDDADCTFTLCPVEVVFENSGNSYWDYSQTESAVVPYVKGPAMARVLLDKAKIMFTYSNQVINY